MSLYYEFLFYINIMIDWLMIHITQDLCLLFLKCYARVVGAFEVLVIKIYSHIFL